MASFDKITNNISQGLQTAGQAVSLIQNIKQARDAAKNGGSIPIQQTTAGAQTSAPANATQAGAASGGSTTNLNIGLSKKTLIIGGACVAGLLLVVLLARR